MTTAPDWQLEITAQLQPQGIQLRGEVDMLTLPSLELALELLLDAPSDVILDMHELTFLDVPGARALAATAIQLRSTGRGMHLRGASPLIRRILDVLGWTDLFEFRSTVPVAALAQPLRQQAGTPAPLAAAA